MAEGDLEGEDTSIIDEICLIIAEEGVMDAITTMLEMCVNNGQVTLVFNVAPDMMDQVDDISQGQYDYVFSDHPEAVGIIVEQGNQICQDTAVVCEETRIAFEAAFEEL